jgi:hypothetical protein
VFVDNQGGYIDNVPGQLNLTQSARFRPQGSMRANGVPVAAGRAGFQSTADLEGQVSRLLQFCELPFEEACLNFHKTERNVRTPSAEQVRKPVSRAGVAQWKPFSDHLGPLKQALGDELTALSYGA